MSRLYGSLQLLLKSHFQIATHSLKKLLYGHQVHCHHYLDHLVLRFRSFQGMDCQRFLIPAILFVAVSIIAKQAECRRLESPQYTVLHSESDFEVRFYRESAWMTASTDQISSEKATRDGFHRLFQFIQGANLNSSRIHMTVPVLTSIIPGAGPLHSSAYAVKFYLPVKFQAIPPLPLPELNLQPDWWKGHCIAVRKFSGFARDENIVKEAENLAISLSRSRWANSTTTQSGYAYSIAQYNSPFRFIGRVNEVWVDVEGAEADGCNAQHLAAYENSKTYIHVKESSHGLIIGHNQL